MTRQAPLQIRLHGWLLKILLPALGRDFVLEANTTFAELYFESRSASLAQRAQLWSREIRSLTTTMLSELRQHGSSQHGPSDGVHPRLRRHGTGPGMRRASSALENFIRDLRHALRGLFKTPLFATVAVSSLALGVAAATAIFSVINASWLRDAPHISRPDELVRVFGRFPDDLPYGPLAYADITDIRQQASTLQDVAAYSTETLTWSDDTQSSRRIQAEEVSDNWFAMLGVPLALGRGFLPEDTETGMLVTVIGYRMWERDFARDPSVLGRSIRLNGRLHTIIGVAPENMLAHEEPLAPELWVLVPEFERKERGYIGLKAVARPRDGVTLAQVQGELDLIAQRLGEQYPDGWTSHNGQQRGLAVLSDRAGRIPPGQRGQVAVMLGVLVAVVTLVLLIACSNVANLLLTRAWRRRTEIAVRLALGAGRGRLVGQLLGESIALALLSGGLALLLIHWIASVLRAGGMLVQLPAPIDLSVDWRVTTFALGLSLLAGVIFGLVPALQASNPSLTPRVASARAIYWSWRRWQLRSCSSSVRRCCCVACNMLAPWTSALIRAASPS
jgi:predicted permease